MLRILWEASRLVTLSGAKGLLRSFAADAAQDDARSFFHSVGCGAAERIFLRENAVECHAVFFRQFFNRSQLASDSVVRFAERNALPCHGVRNGCRDQHWRAFSRPHPLAI